MTQNNSKSVKPAQGVVAKLREIRDNDMGGTVTYYFNNEETHLDFKGDPTNIPSKVTEDGRKWVQVTQINREIFFDHKGKKTDLIMLAQNFAATAWDLGAYKFEI